jgi:CBS domain-containing protein
MKVQDIMSKTLSCCAATDTLQRAAQLMKEHDVGAIPVVNDCDERRLLGIITDRDICMKVVAQGNLTSTAKVSEAMTSTPATCRPNESIEGCESLMKRHQVRRIPVVDSSGVCVGIISQADIALPRHARAYKRHSGGSVAAPRPAAGPGGSGERVNTEHRVQSSIKTTGRHS